MDFLTVILLACAAGFVISAVDYWLDIGFWRAVIAPLVGAIGAYFLGMGWAQIAVAGLASGFLALGFIQVVERINYRVVRR